MANFVRDGGPFQEVIGLVPAAGQGTRISPLPCSKELYPVGFRQVDEKGTVQPKVVCHYLLEKMRAGELPTTISMLMMGFPARNL